jgi:hypothetical protein
MLQERLKYRCNEDDKDEDNIASEDEGLERFVFEVHTL